MADDAKHSKDLKVQEAAEKIAALPSVEAVRAYVADDERQGITAAAQARIAEISASDPGQGIRLGQGSDVRAVPGKPLEAGGTGKKLVRTRYPLDRFEHGIDGVPVITAQGVEVDASKADELLELAAAHGARLEEVEG